jgi:hypothetical protein
MSNAITLAAKPTLLGELVLLRPVSVADLDGAAELVTDPETMRLTGTQAAFDRGRLEQWYATRGGQGRPPRPGRRRAGHGALCG